MNTGKKHVKRLTTCKLLVAPETCYLPCTHRPPLMCHHGSMLHADVLVIVLMKEQSKESDM